MSAVWARRAGCAVLAVAAVAAAPFVLLYGVWIVGGGNHRAVEQRLVSPDGRFEVRVQNDVRGSIQPMQWVVYVKPAGVRSDDPDASCAVAEVHGEDGWRAVRPQWRGGALLLHSVPQAATMTLRSKLALRATGCAMVPVRVVER